MQGYLEMKIWDMGVGQGRGNCHHPCYGNENLFLPPILHGGIPTWCKAGQGGSQHNWRKWPSLVSYLLSNWKLIFLSDLFEVGIRPTDCACFDQTKFNLCSNSMCRNGQVWIQNYILTFSCFKIFFPASSFNTVSQLSSVNFLKILY